MYFLCGFLVAAVDGCSMAMFFCVYSVCDFGLSDDASLSDFDMPSLVNSDDDEDWLGAVVGQSASFAAGAPQPQPPPA